MKRLLRLLSPHGDYADFTREEHRHMDENVPEDSILFLGDSLTHGLVTSAVTTRGVNFGVGGLTAAALLQNLPTYKSIHRCRCVCLMVGTNDVLRGEVANLSTTYRAILQAIPAPVVLSTIAPIAKMPKESRQAAEMAKQSCLPSTRLVDLHSALLDVPGVLRDGVHLSSKGYSVWIDLLRQVIP